MTASRPGRLRPVLVTALLTVLVLLAGEASLRVWAYFFRHPYQRFDSRLGMITLVPGYQGRVGTDILRINSLGLRAPEFAPAKPGHVRRVIALGDSVTFGLSGDGCDYPAVLQRLFDADGRGRVEVINAGVEGYNSEDALRFLRGRLLAFSPDLVTMLIGWNDLVKQDPAQPAASAFETRVAYAMYDVYLVKFWRRLLYLQLRPLLLKVETGLPPDEEAAFRTYVPLVYKEHLEELIASVRASGGRVVLFTLPSILRENMSQPDIRKLYFPHYTYNLRKFLLLHQRYNETIRSVGRAYGIPVVELQKAVAGRESELFMDTAHLECEGHRVLGAYLYPILARLLLERLPHITAANRR